MQNLRNFSIIAHIDHGKSTLADRLLELTGSLAKRTKADRILDTLDLEKEKGITIKLQTARMLYKDHILNLIDTPGHVDFSYEVSRSLAASEGALLLVDATQGIQAQTLTTVYKALEHDLEIIPVINKIDLPSADFPKVLAELEANFGFSKDEVLKISAKTGEGVPEVLDAIIARVPAPEIPETIDQNLTQALIFDSFYDEHKGVVVLTKVVSGSLQAAEELLLINSGTVITPVELGYMSPNQFPQNEVKAGEVGYVATGLKDIRAARVGDTITLASQAGKVETLPGYVQPKPMVFASVYPIDADEFGEFQESLDKLALNDAAITYTKESNPALGSGFNCGFLGLLHLEVTLERLEREFELDLITTTPSVEYLIELTTNDMSKVKGINTGNIDDDGKLKVRSAADFPDQSLVENTLEPYGKLEILTPEDYLGGIMDLCEKHRGSFVKMEYLTGETGSGRKHVVLKYEIPLAEIVTDFFDKLKSISQGYSSMDYEFFEYRPGDIKKVNVLVNGNQVDALSFMCHAEFAERRGRNLISKLKEIIPKQQFKIPLQAAVGAHVVARETISALRKDVTAKLYGGDVTRKRKLLEKQKKGKKRLQKFGNVEIPKSAFLAALSS